MAVNSVRSPRHRGIILCPTKQGMKTLKEFFRYEFVGDQFVCEDCDGSHDVVRCTCAWARARCGRSVHVRIGIWAWTCRASEPTSHGDSTGTAYHIVKQGVCCGASPSRTHGRLATWHARYPPADVCELPGPACDVSRPYSCWYLLFNWAKLVKSCVITMVVRPGNSVPKHRSGTG
jgi:hypothetical protein